MISTTGARKQTKLEVASCVLPLRSPLPPEGCTSLDEHRDLACLRKSRSGLLGSLDGWLVLYWYWNADVLKVSTQ